MQPRTAMPFLLPLALVLACVEAPPVDGIVPIGMADSIPRLAEDSPLPTVPVTSLGDPCAQFVAGDPGPRPGPGTNAYLPLSCRSFEVVVPVSQDVLRAEAPFGCYGGGVHFEWDGMDTVGALRHDRVIDSADSMACSDADLAPIFQAASGGGGVAAAQVSLKTFESYQFSGSGGCVRGLYEVVELRFLPSPARLFSGYAFTVIQELPEASCELLIDISASAR
jgi:hypothetical protein